MASDPLVLGFDTSAAFCAAVLLSGDEVLAERYEEMAKGQAERLMVMLEEVLAEAGAGWRDLAALGVGIGPGNFTGVRISVSAARGLALGLGIPAVGVSTLEAMALGTERPVLCGIDARRDMFYAQLFNSGGQSAPVLCGLDCVPWPHQRAMGTVIGHRAAELAEISGSTFRQPIYPPAEAIARIAWRRMQDIDLPRPAPIYLRPADAAPPRADRNSCKPGGRSPSDGKSPACPWRDQRTLRCETHRQFLPAF